jgi:hypothetical protein
MGNLDSQQLVEDTLNNIEESDSIHPDNKELLSDYERDLSLDGKSPATIQKRLSHMKIVAEYVGDKPFSEMTKEDVKDLVAGIQERDIAEATFEGYKKIICFFWKWMSDEDEYPEEVDWIE